MISSVRLSFASVAGIKYPDKMLLRTERVYFSSQFQIQSIIAGSQGNRNLKLLVTSHLQSRAENECMHACLLLNSLSSLLYILGPKPRKRCSCSSGSSYINSHNQDNLQQAYPQPNLI